MALYKDPTKFTQNYHADFDKIFHPAQTVPHSGIYSCRGCGREIASNKGDPFPPQNHHQHPARTPITWQLVAATKGS